MRGQEIINYIRSKRPGAFGTTTSLGPRIATLEPQLASLETRVTALERERSHD